MDESYEDFSVRMFGTPYMVWHDGPDTSSLARLQSPEEREHAFQMLLKGMAQQDGVAIEGLGVLDAERALPYVKKLRPDLTNQGIVVAYVQFMKKFDPTCEVDDLVNLLVHVVNHGGFTALDAIIALRQVPTAHSVKTLLSLVEKSSEYLVRYHAANSLLHIAGVAPSSIDQHPALFESIRGPSEGGAQPEDYARYAEAAASLRAMLGGKYSEEPRA